MDANEIPYFSTRLLQYRLEHDLTQGEMGEVLGCSQVFVSEMEAGKKSPSRSTLHFIDTDLSGFPIYSVDYEPGGVELAQVKALLPDLSPESLRRVAEYAQLLKEVEYHRNYCKK